MENRSRLERYFILGLNGLYQGEKVILDNLKEMHETANSPELKDVFAKHIQETENQVKRLEKIGTILGETINTEEGEETLLDKGKHALKTILFMHDGKNKIVGALIEKGQDLLKKFEDDESAKDLCLAGSTQFIESFEVNCYEELLTLAGKEDFDPEIETLLKESLEEEKRAHEALKSILGKELGKMEYQTI